MSKTAFIVKMEFRNWSE